MESLVYFAYGSNMCSGRLRSRTPSARFLAIGRLAGYKLAFHKKSIDGSGKANAFSTGHESDCVIGVLFEIDAKEKSDLDYAEGLGRGYEETDVVVTTDLGDIQSIMYYATSIAEELVPFSWYVRFVIDGARQHSLPEDYVDRIGTIPQIDDPNRSRDAKNRAVVC